MMDRLINFYILLVQLLLRIFSLVKIENVFRLRSMDSFQIWS